MKNFVFNEAMKIRRKTLIELTSLLESDKLKETLGKLPKKILTNSDNYRESIYHAREVLSQRIKVYLGLDYNLAKDIELYECSESIEQILDNKSMYNSKNKYISIIEEACDLCPSKKYYITDGCRNCLAKSCENICPKNAIFKSNNRMQIDTDKCVNCGLCANVCNYNAIIVQERPCESACHLKAIKVEDGKNSPVISEEQCVNCGNCYKECPFGAIETPSQILQLQHALNNGENITAIFAPSIAGQFGMKVNSSQIKESLLKIGFYDSVEAAVGADIVAAEEASIVENSDNLVTTSCCPAFVDLINKHYPEYIENISHEYSPMTYLASEIKKNNPDTKIAFIGPCIAKKKEADDYDFVDYVITFEELGALLIAKKIEPSELTGSDINGSDLGWNFAQSGGVAESVINRVNRDINSMKMNGLCEAKVTFAKLKNGQYDLLEGMGCSGGCIGGPGILVNPNMAKAKLKTANK